MNAKPTMTSKPLGGPSTKARSLKQEVARIADTIVATKEARDALIMAKLDKVKLSQV